MQRGQAVVSDEERREVAARLRNDVSESECIDYAVFRIIHDVFGIENATGAKAAHILADLIDRPTCSMHDVGDKVEQEYCMSDVKPYPWRFCPMCGAEVVEREEDE